MKRALASVTHILAVGSGKGGVGKTTVTVNLALALAGRGLRVGIFDADIYGPNVPLMLGIRRAQAASGLAFVPVARVDQAPYIPPLARYGLHVMSIGLLLGEQQTIMPAPAFAGRIVTQTLWDVAWPPLDYLLIDLPPGTGEPQQSLLQAVDIAGVVIVTTPQDLSLLDAGRFLGLFRQAGTRILGVVQNMSDLHCPHCGERIEIFYHSPEAWRVEGEELEVLGRIPLALAISRGIDAHHPLMQTAPAGPEGRAFQEIAARLVAQLPPAG